MVMQQVAEKLRRDYVGRATVLLTVALGVTLCQSASAQTNYNQIALLRWYPASNGISFAVGTSPYGIAFDGANMWVASYGSRSITKIRANDGLTRNTIPFTGSPYYLAFDGSNIW